MKTMNNKQEKHRSTFAVLFYINRTKIRKDGKCQLLCRISIDAESEQVGTGISVDPAIWEPKDGKAGGKNRNALGVNNAIGKLSKHSVLRILRILRMLSAGFNFAVG